MKSPAKLIESLKHGDPQSIAITVVFAFFLSVLWFSWTMFFPPEEETIPFTQRNNISMETPEALLSQTLAQQQEGFKGDASLNPFFLEVPKPKPRPPRDPGPSDNNGGNEPKPTPEPRPTRPPRPQPEPEKPTVTYVFQGMLTRPDNVDVAFIQIPKEGKSAYVKSGDVLGPLTIVTVLKEGVEVQSDPQKPSFLLLPGEPQTFDYSP
jgi:hypothetical protein